jgi:anthranilate/para-aminobenzoate synthase component II
MFCSFGDDALEFENNRYTLNSHTWSIEPRTFQDDERLKEFWDVTSTSISPVDNKEFVASIEAKKYPFMATQFHPEKVT